MSKKGKTTLSDGVDEDENLFLEAMEGVVALKESPDKVELQKNSPVLRLSDKPKSPLDQSDDTLQKEWGPLSTLSFARPWVDKKVKKLLRKGTFPIKDSLDLHGLTWKEARREVLIFLREGSFLGKCVLIIHGKGHGAVSGIAPLKSNLYNLLPTLSCVEAAQTASPQHGGLGAVYILLGDS